MSATQTLFYYWKQTVTTESGSGQTTYLLQCFEMGAMEMQIW
jgi:hypothetical protein